MSLRMNKAASLVAVARVAPLRKIGYVLRCRLVADCCGGTT